jgi:hypothetical protein
LLQQAGYKPAFHLVAQNQMDREHPARPVPQTPAIGAKANGPRSACCAYITKHQPMLQHAGYKRARHGARIANPPVAACAKGGSTIRAPFGFSQHQ